MNATSLRHSLRIGTADLHGLLDSHVGGHSCVEAYHSYLTGTYAFRMAVEPALNQGPVGTGVDWQIMPIGDALRQDMADLRLTLPDPPPVPDLDSPAALAGAFYVIEGSALGAKLIARRAVQSGFDAMHGGRHLALQTVGGPARWQSFLKWLESVDVPADLALTHARAVFRLAMDAYGMRDAMD